MTDETSRARTHGPLKVSCQAIPKGFPDVHRARFIDIGPLRGTRVPLALKSAGDWLGITEYRNGRLLLEVGFFRRFGNCTPSRGAFVLLDPASSKYEIYEEWVEKHGTFASYEDFRIHRSVRRCAGISAAYPFPEKVLEGAFQTLVPVGNFWGELNGVLPISPVNLAAVNQWMLERLSVHCRARQAKSLGEVVTLHMFQQSLPAELASAPRSCFADLVGHEHEPPGENLLPRLWALKELYEAGSMYALATAPRLRRPNQLREHVLAIERIEDIMRTFAPSEPWTIKTYKEALDEYALRATIRPQDLPAVRDLTIRLWRMITDRLRKYVRQVDPKGKLGLAQFLPPHFQIDRATRARLNELYGDLRPEGRERRKARSFEALAELDEVLEAARNRRDEMREFGRLLRVEIDAFGPTEEWRNFQASVPALDGRGTLSGGMKVVRFRVWRVSAAWRSLAAGKDARENTVAQQRRLENGTNKAPAPNSFIVEHLDPRPLAWVDDEPWLIGFSRVGTAISPANIPPPIQELRQDVMIRNGLPGYVGIAAGILYFDRDRAQLARHAQHLGRHMFALEEAEYGMRLAYHALDSVAQTWRRINEVMQQTQDDWDRVDDIGAEPRHAQFVVPKVSRREDLASVALVDLTLCETSVNEALDVCELHERRCGFESLPIMEAELNIRWKCAPGKFVFSMGGRSLMRQHLPVLLRYLLAGWPRFTFHDFRHTLAEDAALDEVPLLIIGHALGQSSEVDTRYYASLPDWARKIVDRASIRRRVKRLDERVRITKEL